MSSLIFHQNILMGDFFPIFIFMAWAVDETEGKSSLGFTFKKENMERITEVLGKMLIFLSFSLMLNNSEFSAIRRHKLLPLLLFTPPTMLKWKTLTRSLDWEAEYIFSFKEKEFSPEMFCVYGQLPFKASILFFREKWMGEKLPSFEHIGWARNCWSHLIIKGF